MERNREHGGDRIKDHAADQWPDLQRVIGEQRRLCREAAPPALDERREALAALGAEIRRRQQDILEALRLDLGKCAAEAYMSELGLVLGELRLFERKLKSWAAPRRCKPTAALWPARSLVVPEPFGQALILSPWNYPFQLAVLPLIAALAAGNRVILAPSADSPVTSALLRELLGAALPSTLAHVALGGVPVAEKLLSEKFDFIFYTGSTRVGRLVMEAAARDLTPLCLELGGKSPVLVTEDADPDLAARRIAWGKILNAGQTCVAPDYLLAPRGMAAVLKGKIEREFRRMLSENPLDNESYGRIVNRRSFDRLLDLASASMRPAGRIPQATAKEKTEQSAPSAPDGPGGTPPYAGQPIFTEMGNAGEPAPEEPPVAEKWPAADPATLKIAPAVFFTDPDSPIMREEIFGPLLPLLEYEDFSDALAFIRSRPKPLAAYIFTGSAELAERFMREVSCGGCCVNDVVMQAASPHLPFGGVGPSGLGRYHGRSGFDLFSNLKGVVRPSRLPLLRWLDPPLRYPPYGKRKLALLRRFLR